MRLEESKIVAGLQHPAAYVRDTVLDYLESCHRNQPDVTRHAIEAVDRFGWKDAFFFPHRLASFELDDVSADWILAQMDRSDDGGPSENLRRHLGHLLANADVEIARPRLERIFRCCEIQEQKGPRFDGRRSDVDLLKLRIRNWEKSPDECWSLLEEHCRAVANVREFADADIPYAQTLVERIAAAGNEFADRPLRVLDRKPRWTGGYEDWLVGLAINLAGRLRLETAIEPIYRHFRVDWDWYNEEISRALVRIGTPAVTELVGRQYFRRREQVRIYSHGILEAVHHDGAVDCIMPLAAGEEDFGYRGQLGVALASHFDARGIEPALAIYWEEPDDPERLTIIERLFAHAQLAELDLPELDQWERQIQRSWASFKQGHDLLAPLMQQFLEGVEDVWPDDPSAEESDSLSGLPRDRALLGEGVAGHAVLQPIMRTTERIGRNDPCPCGSGKKYKKCCWGREDV